MEADPFIQKVAWQRRGVLAAAPALTVGTEAFTRQ